MILRDEAAARWFAARGLVGEGEPQVAVDERSVAGLGITRAWHGPAQGALRAPDRSILLVLQLDGDVRLAPADDGADGLVVAAGDSFALAAGQGARITASTAVARIEIELPADAEFLLDARRSPAALWSRGGAEWSRSALVSLTNIVLNLELGTELEDTAHLRNAFRSCAAAFFEHVDDRRAVRTVSSPEALARRAVALLESRARDPAFSVHELAGELDVTPAYLSRAFRSTGSVTPGRALRALRRAHALALLEEERDAGDRVDVAELARRSGFASTSSLRRALRSPDPS
ncbi:helix-turn-helix domain-containing protein [Rathayibacter sp. SD072]|uniref:helix-turn-helix domain-containing protein n=1 Tax=Rathayibacter sp. SD072 TaxID=2781731 RepID=UPI001A970394|nr:helix-turn-helix domain-containing protein [Rathayibacter sp. SD072]MBO0985752.1 helix-turn-helix domain-containing protein [Rathayibacter sp. SD072]